MTIAGSLLDTDVLMSIVAGITTIALITFLALATYLVQRRKERDNYYRFELRKKAIEQGAPVQTLMELQRQEDLLQQRRRREGLKLGGLVTAGISVGMLGIYVAEKDPTAIGVALLPLGIGLAIFVYAQWLAPRGTDTDRGGGPPQA